MLLPSTLAYNVPELYCLVQNKLLIYIFYYFFQCQIQFKKVYAPPKRCKVTNEEDGGGYDVSGDFSMIYNIAVVDLWWILVKKGLELVFCFDGYEILD
ncbi:unnamed protein product [Lathyrus oleraceus]